MTWKCADGPGECRDQEWCSQGGPCDIAWAAAAVVPMNTEKFSVRPPVEP